MAVKSRLDLAGVQVNNLDREVVRVTVVMAADRQELAPGRNRGRNRHAFDAGPVGSRSTLTGFPVATSQMRTVLSSRRSRPVCRQG